MSSIGNFQKNIDEGHLVKYQHDIQRLKENKSQIIDLIKNRRIGNDLKKVYMIVEVSLDIFYYRIVIYIGDFTHFFVFIFYLIRY